MTLRKRKDKDKLDRTLWRTSFGRGCGRIVRQTTESVNESMHEKSYKTTFPAIENTDTLIS